jgi:hypothetical protein
MRRWLAMLCALVVAVAIPASAAAGRVFKETDHSVNLYCDGIIDTSGTWFAFAGVGISDQSGAFGGLDAWHALVPSGAPDITSNPDQPVAATWDGSILSGSIPVVDVASGDALGDATFSATLTPLGEPSFFSDSFRDGNRHIRFDGTSQPFQPSGTLSLPGGVTFDLSNCYADESTVTFSATNPNAYTASYSQRFVGCELSNTAGDTGNIFIDLSGDFLFVDAQVSLAGSTSLIGATYEGPPYTDPLTVALQTYDPETGEPTADGGSLTLSATATDQTFTELLRNANARRLTKGTVIDIEGTLTIAGHTFDLGACIGQSSTTKEIATFPAGPKPGGKVPSNDLPSGAITLKAGRSVTIQTKGTAPDAEAPFACLTFTDPVTGEPFSVPVGNTVWYTFTGTGSPMTIDTAGSDYDTVVAIYTLSGDEYVPVPGGCVDDTALDPIGRTLQASVTIPTVAGTVYYVQIGGFPDSSTYGNLRVVLR